MTAFGTSLLAQVKQMIAPPTPPAAERTIQERAADLEKKQQKIENAGRKQAIVALATKVGVDPEKTEIFEREFVHAHGEGLKYDLEAGLSYVDSLNVTVPVDQIATKFLTTKLGSLFKAAPPVRTTGNPINPTAQSPLGSGDGKKFYSELSPDERAKMTPAQQRAYAQDDLRRSKAG